MRRLGSTSAGEDLMQKIEITTIHGDHEFQIPVKCIKSQLDMNLWEGSVAYQEYVGFILAINEAVRAKPNSCKSEIASDTVEKMVDLLDALDKYVDETPPIEQPQRFGNYAFRTWLEKINIETFNLLKILLDKDLHRAMAEIKGYLVESFGNSTRIDYGTGHEASFIMFLCCLFKIGALVDTDKPYVATVIFARYMELVRKLQKTYRMEPAGSHGVWSLDDYQFVPFIWGSSQLIDHTFLEPPSFLQPELIDSFANEYLFFSAIQYINSVKTGPFAEHSNQLWGISGVASWSKINTGLIKMYKAEVLGKFPVAQHMIFGSLLPLKSYKPYRDPSKPYMGMTRPVTDNSSVCDNDC